MLRTAESVRAAVSAALNPLVDISECPDTVAQVATDAALRQAYWALREHASGYRGAKAFRETQARWEADRTDQRAYSRANAHEFYARGIEAAARTIAETIAELLGEPEHEIEEGGPTRG